MSVWPGRTSVFISGHVTPSVEQWSICSPGSSELDRFSLRDYQQWDYKHKVCHFNVVGPHSQSYNINRLLTAQREVLEVAMTRVTVPLNSCWMRKMRKSRRCKGCFSKCKPNWKTKTNMLKTHKYSSAIPNSWYNFFNRDLFCCWKEYRAFRLNSQYSVIYWSI